MNRNRPVRPGSWFPALSDLAIGLTLSTLCYMRVVRWVIFATPGDLFFCKIRPGHAEILIALAVVGALAAILTPVVRLARRGGRPAADVLFLLAVVAAAGSIAVLVNRWNMETGVWLGPAKWMLLKGAVLGAILLVLLRYRRGAVAAASTGLLILSPLLAFTTFHAAQAWTAHPPAALQYRAGPHERAAMRLVWVLFDEWDYRLTYAERPAGLRLDVFDRLSRESLRARHATSPGMRTLTSVPALLSGSRVSDLQPASETAAIARFEGEREPRDYRSAETIFDLAHARHYRSAALGWYLPYPRLFGDVVEECYWSGAAYYLIFPSIPPAEDGMPSQILARQMQLWANTNAHSFGLAARQRRDYARELRELLDRAKRAGADPDLDLVFLHIPAPHPPGICREVLGEGCPENAYFGNLRVADWAAGELLSAIESGPRGGETALLLSSDHPFRRPQETDGKFDARVPFLVRLPRQAEGADYDRPFNTVLSRDLAAAILQGRLRGAADVAEWIDRSSQVANVTRAVPARKTGAR